MGRSIRGVIVVLALFCLGAASPASAQDSPIEAFFGEYVGASISMTDQGLSQRDLNVSIRPEEKGFRLDWTTVTHKSEGRLKPKSYSVRFEPTKRDNIYRSAMRPNLFGKDVPLDPLEGDPYVWARIEGETLTVYVMLITDDGGAEMQVYARTLTDDGLALKFSRFREDKTLKQITGTLNKVSD